MDKSEAIVSVDDAIRKLVQLSSKEKVWAQEMLLQVNDQCLRLLDVETQVWQPRGSRRPGPRLRGPPRGAGRMRRAKVRWGREGCRPASIQATLARVAPCPPLAPACLTAVPRQRQGLVESRSASVPRPPSVMSVTVSTAHTPQAGLPGRCVRGPSPPGAGGCEPASVGPCVGVTSRVAPVRPGQAASGPPVPQEELENFPLPTVRHSQTVPNQPRCPSVLLLVCQDSEQSKPDIHFFHCDQVEVRRGGGGRAQAPAPA